METKKVLIIHPDVIIRRAFSQVLQEGTPCLVIASDDIAHPEDLIRDVQPDLVFMQVRRAENDRLIPFTAIHGKHPDLPIVIISNRTKEGAEIAISALFKGAVDCITKPEHQNSVLFAERHFYKRLLPMVRSIFAYGSDGKGGTNPQSSFYRSTEPQEGPLDDLWPLSLVVIGGCIGGPSALHTLFKKIPENLSVPILAVQRFPKIYTKVLAQQLDDVTQLNVKEARDGVRLEPGSIWIAPGGSHCELSREEGALVLRTHRGPRHHGFRPSIDVTFQSAGQLLGPGVLGVILSGYGKDGVSGSAVIQQGGGQLVVQNPDTAIAGEMPQSVIDAGLCDAILLVEEIAQQIERRARNNAFPSQKEQGDQMHSIPRANFRNSDRSFYSKPH